MSQTENRSPDNREPNDSSKPGEPNDSSKPDESGDSSKPGESGDLSKPREPGGSGWNRGALGARESCVTISARVRLARNISDTPFPGRVGDERARALLERVRAAFFDAGEDRRADYLYVDMSQMDAIDKMMMVEQRLISPDLIAGDKPSAAIVKKDETLSVMINEEDHLRIQCVMQSDDIDAAYRECASVEGVFDRAFELAFDEKYGYLTSCPTNLGTGMRASFMLHLPALTVSGHIKTILESCGKIGVAVRGLYGENTGSSGNLYQFSNQGSLGRTEAEIIESVKSVRAQVVGHEIRLREALYKQNRSQFEDRAFRALGTLRYARRMTTEEFMKLWSDVRLGMDMGVIGASDADAAKLDRTLTLIQPAYIQKMYGRMLNTEERDMWRAKLTREQLGR